MNLIFQRYGKSVTAFRERADGISSATFNRIANGDRVSDDVKQRISRSFGYGADIWEAQDVTDRKDGTARTVRDLEREFLGWLEAGSRHKATSRLRLPTQELDFLAQPHRRIVGRDRESGELVDHLNQFEQSLVNVFGASGCGKTEFVRSWWSSAGNQRIAGHIVAIPCRQLSGTEDLFDALRRVLGNATNTTSDLTRLFIDFLNSSGGRSNLLVFDDLDSLMHGERTSEATGAMRFDRAGLRELIARLLAEVRPITVVLISRVSLAPMFEVYPNFKPIDLNKGLDAESGAGLMREIIGTEQLGIGFERLKSMSSRLRGLPQSLVYFAQLVRNAPRERWPALLELYPDAVAPGTDGALEGASGVLNQLSGPSLNFVRAVAAMERGMPGTVLDALVQHEKTDRRIFCGDATATSFDSNLDNTLGLVEQTSGIVGGGATFDMHLTLRSSAVRAWRRDDPRSFERFYSWLARFYWSRAFPDTEKGFHPRQLPTEREARLQALLNLVESACNLVRAANLAADAVGTQGATSDRSFEHRELGNDLLKDDIEYIFGENASPTARIRFAHRRILVQRVEKTTKHKARFGLTRQFGRHEAMIRFLALLAPQRFGHTDQSEPIEQLEHGDQAEVLFDVGLNSTQLGWLDTAIGSFTTAASKYERNGDVLNVSRCKALESFTLMRRGRLADARDALCLAGSFLSQAQKLASSAKLGDQSRAIDAMAHRVKSYSALMELLSGKLEAAHALQLEILQTDTDHGAPHQVLLKRVRTRIADGELTPTVRGMNVVLPELVHSGDRGRLFLETALARLPHKAGDLLGHWWACYQLAVEDGVEVEHTHLHILESAIHRLCGDAERSQRALLDADRVGENFNVHFPVRLEWRLEQVRHSLTFHRVGQFKHEERRLQTVLDLSRDYGFKLLESDALVVKAWLDREMGHSKAVVDVSLNSARRLNEVIGYSLRNQDIDRLRAGESPLMVPLI